MVTTETRSIRVTIDTYARLAKLGDLSESFDSVIKKLLDRHENTTNNNGSKVKK